MITSIEEIQETFPPDAEFSKTQNGFNVLFENQTFCFYYNKAKTKRSVVILKDDREYFWPGEELKAFYKIYRRAAQSAKDQKKVPEIEEKQANPGVLECIKHVEDKIGILSKDKNRNNIVTINVLREMKEHFRNLK